MPVAVLPPGDGDFRQLSRGREARIGDRDPSDYEKPNSLSILPEIGEVAPSDSLVEGRFSWL